MAQLRDLKRRMKSVSNTTKITRTMELIATAKAKVCQDRIQKAQPYFFALAEIAGEARKGESDDEERHALLEEREVKNVGILVVVANRGLCGGYNSNALRMARDHREKLIAEGKTVSLVPSGKKSLAWLRFQNVPFEGPGYTQFEDKPPFAEVEKVADEMIGKFLRKELDRVDVIYTHYFSSGRQSPVTETLLPIQAADEGEKTAKEGDGAESSINFIIEPDPKSILDTLFPLQVKLHLYRVYLEAAASEQIARRMAMKNATDNAQEVHRMLKMAYNRARQSQITKEILEVLGGAEAVA
ncbi:ATP synthase F1 subunit gamma [Planctomycetota bacterium]|nr:ATP synthase F1 subunit gamma [Planctomycetota bacterium]